MRAQCYAASRSPASPHACATAATLAKAPRKRGKTPCRSLIMALEWHASSGIFDRSCLEAVMAQHDAVSPPSTTITTHRLSHRRSVRPLQNPRPAQALGPSSPHSRHMKSGRQGRIPAVWLLKERPCKSWDATRKGSARRHARARQKYRPAILYTLRILPENVVQSSSGEQRLPLRWLLRRSPPPRAMATLTPSARPDATTAARK